LDFPREASLSKRVKATLLFLSETTPPLAR
jgi:hypothetical protein